MTNPFNNEKLKQRKPTEKAGKKRHSGEPFMEEELEQEIQD